MSNEYREQTDGVRDPAGSRTGTVERRRRTVGLGTGLVTVTAALVLGATQLAASGLSGPVPAWSQTSTAAGASQHEGGRPDPASAGCSTDGVDPDYPSPGVGGGAGATATFIAAGDCDSEALVVGIAENGTWRHASPSE
jgi:hypothetical protein